MLPRDRTLVLGVLTSGVGQAFWRAQGFRAHATALELEPAAAAVSGLVGLVPLLASFGQLPSFGGRERARFSSELGLFWPCTHDQAPRRA